ncbi:sulfotransferase family 2 domain-containing protein [Ectothiorhodospira shaposhnikovii]|uniref:sulfotransferase family 2 domain-containing protein n=1 Tax=Ectothiorhodospira shaposhnikovii TaxID=1054 RepID=UPI001EE83738|nr:sulfotransferase family 2 domain-containing protein [Ectothiorhodospira shaposhnikovii]MCG5514332.1 sulfotransferase family protein [Ectothiorhodospira shaposhnikovii]
MMGYLRKNLNLYRRYPYWSREKVVFVHVPKAAGTSINKALYGRTIGHYTAVEIRSRFPRLYSRSFVFSVVRNPWDRLLSAYRFAKVGRTDSMGIAHPERYQIPEFSTFERFLQEWLVYQDLHKADYVFQPQTRFVCEPECTQEVIVDYLGKMEDLEVDIKAVENKLGRSLKLPRSNVTQDSRYDFRNAYLNPGMIDIVQQLYAHDISAFNYSFE